MNTYNLSVLLRNSPPIPKALLVTAASPEVAVEFVASYFEEVGKKLLTILEFEKAPYTLGKVGVSGVPVDLPPCTLEEKKEVFRKILPIQDEEVIHLAAVEWQ